MLEYHSWPDGCDSEGCNRNAALHAFFQRYHVILHCPAGLALHPCVTLLRIAAYTGRSPSSQTCEISWSNVRNAWVCRRIPRSPPWFLQSLWPVTDRCGVAMKRCTFNTSHRSFGQLVAKNLSLFDAAHAAVVLGDVRSATLHRRRPRLVSQSGREAQEVQV